MNSNLQYIMESLPEDSLMPVGLEGAILGFDDSSERLILSIQACLDIIVKRDHMSYDDALEFFYYNVAGSYVGEKTPIWCYDLF